MAESIYNESTGEYSNVKIITIAFTVNEDVRADDFIEAVTNKMYDTLSSSLSEDQVNDLTRGTINIEAIETRGE